MNVLPIVFAMIILMAAITYSRVQSYLVSKTVDRHYQVYFSEVQQQSSNQYQVEMYEKFTTDGTSKEDPPKPVNATRKLPIRSLLQEGNPAVSQLFNNLLSHLFGDQLFFREALESNPLFLDQLLASLQKIGEEVKGDDIDLTKLNFPTEEERLFWYCLLNKPPLEGNSDDEGAQEERLFNQGISSNHLQDLITARNQDAKKPLRLFLAAPDLLFALFQDQSAVSDIVQMRAELYRTVKKDPSLGETLSREFELTFNHLLPRWISPDFINWEVTGTKPSVS